MKLLKLGIKKADLDKNLIDTIQKIDTEKDRFEKIKFDHQSIKFEIENKQKNVTDINQELTEVSQSIH